MSIDLTLVNTTDMTSSDFRIIIDAKILVYRKLLDDEQQLAEEYNELIFKSALAGRGHVDPASVAAYAELLSKRISLNKFINALTVFVRKYKSTRV